MRNKMARLGTKVTALVVAVIAAMTLTPASANAGEALYKFVNIHNHAWYGLHFKMVYASDDAWIWGTSRTQSVSLGEQMESTVVVDGDREIEFYFWIEAGDTLWYNAGVAKYASSYCFDTWGTTTMSEIYRTDCTTGAII